MATRFIHQGMDLDSGDYGPNYAPFGVEDDGGLAIRRGSTYKGAASSDPGVERIPVQRVVTITGTTATLSVSDNGALIVAGTSNSVTVTLPATQKGLTYSLAVGVLTTSGGHNFTPNASDKIIGNGLSKTDGQAVTCSAASDRLGDILTVVGDGADGWYITGVTGTWA